jgi:hypothetical protein
MNKQYKKPPIGLRPEGIAELVFNYDRIAEITEAMERYTQEDAPILKIWVEELKYRISNVKKLVSP